MFLWVILQQNSDGHNRDLVQTANGSLYNHWPLTFDQLTLSLCTTCASKSVLEGKQIHSLIPKPYQLLLIFLSLFWTYFSQISSSTVLCTCLIPDKVRVQPYSKCCFVFNTIHNLFNPEAYSQHLFFSSVQSPVLCSLFEICLSISKWFHTVSHLLFPFVITWLFVRVFFVCKCHLKYRGAWCNQCGVSGLDHEGSGRGNILHGLKGALQIRVMMMMERIWKELNQPMFSYD